MADRVKFDAEFIERRMREHRFAQACELEALENELLEFAGGALLGFAVRSLAAPGYKVSSQRLPLQGRTARRDGLG